MAKLTLDADMTTLLENRKTSDYYPGLLTMPDGKSFQVKIKAKGKYRRKVAEIPPLKVKFTKKSLAAEGLDTLNEVKLVLPCYDNNLGDELIIREYLAYRMFERLTTASVRARLVKLTLRDTHVEKSRKSMYAIVLEDNEETAVRLNGKEFEQYGLPADSLIQNQAALVAMFEYMIGNTDWDIAMMRNVRLIRANDSQKVLVVPYDFDFSGFVSAPYASPSSESGLLTVRDRFLMHHGMSQDALRKAIQVLKSAQNDLNSICRSKYLSRESEAELLQYLETFFQHIDPNGDVPVRMKVPFAAE
ncbi:MAG: hypothetical protein IT260_23945 [Saprospiraceae bacterium]|nr:hypothetical protein [Saprospiraceae bacterium]